MGDAGQSSAEQGRAELEPEPDNALVDISLDTRSPLGLGGRWWLGRGWTDDQGRFVVFVV